MDGHFDIHPTPPYAHDPVAAANPTAGVTTAYVAGAFPTPSIGLARGLFVVPQMNSQGSIAAAKSRGAVSKCPLAAAATTNQRMGKVA